jgi:hypothetical protein
MRRRAHILVHGNSKRVPSPLVGEGQGEGLAPGGPELKSASRCRASPLTLSLTLSLSHKGRGDTV